MTYEKISRVLTQEEYDALTAGIGNLGTLINGFAVNLTLDERKTLPMIGPRNVTFVGRSHDYVGEQEDIAPPCLDVQEFRDDWSLYNQLDKLIKLLEPVMEKLTDTYMAAGAESFAAARIFYDAVKTAAKAGKPGTNTIVADLKSLYKSSARRSTKTQTPQSTETTGTTVTTGTIVTAGTDETTNSSGS